MTPRDAMLAALRGEATSRVPVALLSGGLWAFHRNDLALREVRCDAKRMAEVIARTNAEAQSDAVWVGSGFNTLPVGALGGELRFPGMGPPEVAAPALREAGDVDRVDPARLHEDAAVRAVWETASLLRREMGDPTLLLGSGWGPFSLAALLYGEQRLLEELRTDPVAAREVVAFAGRVARIHYGELVRAGADAVWIAEPTSSGDVLSLADFEVFSLPRIEELARWASSELGVPTLVHICGDASDRVALVPKTGAALLSVDAQVDLTAARAALGTRTALAGNVPPALFGEGSAGEVAAAARRCIEAAGPAPGFVLMPGCDIPAETPMANVRAFVNAARDTPRPSPLASSGEAPAAPSLRISGA